jgi:hypothetical protein
MDKINISNIFDDYEAELAAKYKKEIEAERAFEATPEGQAEIARRAAKREADNERYARQIEEEIRQGLRDEDGEWIEADEEEGDE